ncbi:hypothetical protein D3C75_752520 [compost metagenome]
MINFIKIRTVHKIGVFRDNGLLVEQISRLASFGSCPGIRSDTGYGKRSFASTLFIEGHFIQSKAWRSNGQLHISCRYIQRLAFPDKDITHFLIHIQRTAPGIRSLAEFQLEFAGAYTAEYIYAFQLSALAQIDIEALAAGRRLP